METVQMMNTMPLEEEKEDVLKVEELVPVDYKKLSKEELIGVISKIDAEREHLSKAFKEFKIHIKEKWKHHLNTI